MKYHPEENVVYELIKNDMLIHRLRSHNFEAFCSTPNIVTHIVVGLAEMNANSVMFGGIDSDSYKMKYKNWNKFSKQIIKN